MTHLALLMQILISPVKSVSKHAIRAGSNGSFDVLWFRTPSISRNKTFTAPASTPSQQLQFSTGAKVRSGGKSRNPATSHTKSNWQD